LEKDSLLQVRSPVQDAHQVEWKNAPKSSQELIEVHRRGTQDGIDRIAGNALQAVTFQPVFRLQMSDAEFDRGTPFYPSPATGEPNRPALPPLSTQARRSSRGLVEPNRLPYLLHRA